MTKLSEGDMNKTNKRSFLLALLMGFSILLAGTSSAQDTVKRDFNVNSGGTLQIDVDLGKVTIETTSRETVSVEMVRSAKGVSRKEEQELFDRHEYSIESKGNNVMIDSRIDSDNRDNGLWRRWDKNSKFELEFIITVPESYNVDFRTGAGNITVSDLEGTVRGKTGAGNIVLGTIMGSIDVSSGAGNIEVGGAVGEIYVESGAGNITLDRVQGKLDVSTGAGNIDASIVKAMTGHSELHSGAGNVIVYLDDSVGVEVDADAGIGSAKTDFDLQVKGKWMSKSFEGSVNGGGPKLSLHSGVGNVSLKRF